MTLKVQSKLEACTYKNYSIVLTGSNKYQPSDHTFLRRKIPRYLTGICLSSLIGGPHIAFQGDWLKPHQYQRLGEEHRTPYTLKAKREHIKHNTQPKNALL